jgi:hypothetical protein
MTAFQLAASIASLKTSNPEYKHEHKLTPDSKTQHGQATQVIWANGIKR